MWCLLLKIYFFHFILDKFYVPSGEWDLVSLEAEERDLEFNCCPEKYSSITYELTLDQLSSYYLVYIILPMMALTALFLLVFFIPADSGERMSFGVSILLSLTVYLLVISEIVPANSNSRSMLGTCFTIVFYLLSIGLCGALINTLFTSWTRKPHHYLLKLIHMNIKCNQVHHEVETLSLSPTNSIKINAKVFDNVDEDIDQNEVENIEQNEVEKTNYNEEWKKISKKLDKIYAVALSVLLIFLPLIASAALPTDSLRG